LSVVYEDGDVLHDAINVDLLSVSHESPPPMSATLHTTSAACTAARRVS
jgi:hypothetical protein